MPITELGPHFQFAAWRVPQFSRAVEYPLEVMEEIRAFACDELLQLSHGGNEVGGVLFGTRREDVIRILTWRPIACDHTRGEGLLLSYNDRMNLAVQLEMARQNSDLKDLRPVGCFISHSRGDVALSATDLEIYNGFFPEGSQVALVICPRGNGRAEAGFFVREAGGKLQAAASYETFDLRPFKRPEAAAVPPAKVESKAAAAFSAAAAAPSAAPFDATQTLPVAPPVPAPSFIGNLPVQPVPGADFLRRYEPRRPPSLAPEPPQPPFELPSFHTEEKLATHERWLWAIPILLALGIAAFLLYQRRAESPTSAIALRVSNDAQTVQLAWDANSRVVRDADHAEINIADGGKTSQISLNADELDAGRISYLPQSSDIGFEMTVYPANGDPVHDSTRLIAPGLSPAPVAPAPAQATAPAASAPAASTPAADPIRAPAAVDESALQRQVEQLKGDLSKERARADELQNLVRILENRLGIESTTTKPH